METAGNTVSETDPPGSTPGYVRSWRAEWDSLNNGTSLLPAA